MPINSVRNLFITLFPLIFMKTKVYFEWSRLEWTMLFLGRPKSWLFLLHSYMNHSINLLYCECTQDHCYSQHLKSYTSKPFLFSYPPKSVHSLFHLLNSSRSNYFPQSVHHLPLIECEHSITHPSLPLAFPSPYQPWAHYFILSLPHPEHHSLTPDYRLSQRSSRLCQLCPLPSPSFA